MALRLSGGGEEDHVPADLAEAEVAQPWAMMDRRSPGPVPAPCAAASLAVDSTWLHARRLIWCRALVGCRFLVAGVSMAARRRAGAVLAPDGRPDADRGPFPGCGKGTF